MKPLAKLNSNANYLIVCVLIIFLANIFVGSELKAQDKPTRYEPKNWAEKLGYPAGKKIIMLHADDIGMCE